MSAVSAANLTDDAPLSSWLPGGDRSILLRGGLAQACNDLLARSSTEIQTRATRLVRAKTRNYERQCEAHRLTTVYPPEYKSAEWCVEWRVARETRDWAVRQGILTENDAAAITFAHGNAGTAVQAPTGHRVILPGPPPSSDQLCAAVVVYLKVISEKIGAHKARRVVRKIIRGARRGTIKENGFCWSP